MAVPTEALGGKVAGDQAAGMIKTVLKALDHPVLAFHWSRNPKKFNGPLVLDSVDMNITVGLILGMVLAGLGWEAANWFAKGLASGNDGDATVIPDIAALLTANPVLWLVTDIFGNPVVDKSTGAQKTATVPATFGAAFNQMMRNITVAGPGTASQAMMNWIANQTTGGGSSGTTTVKQPHKGRDL
jgi:hypothetical protein